MVVRIRLELSGPRGCGKTYIANAISDMLQGIAKKTPGRQIELTVVEVWEPAASTANPRLLGPNPDRIDEG